MKDELLGRILATEEELIPSSGFAASVMERIREETAAPRPIPFPWKQAVPGIVLAVGVFGWGGSRTNASGYFRSAQRALYLVAFSGFDAASL